MNLRLWPYVASMLRGRMDREPGERFLAALGEIHATTTSMGIRIGDWFHNKLLLTIIRGYGD